MKKKEIGLTLLVTGLILFNLTACKNMDDEADKIITPTPQITPVVDQEVNRTDTADHSKEPKSPAYIPVSLLTLIENSIKKGDELKAFSSIFRDKELSDDEINSFSTDHVLGEYIDMVKTSTGTVLQVDADNDGIQDLFFRIQDGGTMGNSSRYLLKGNADGTYTMTDASYAEVTEEIAFIDFEGKNYLLQTTFDYNTKINNGFEISCFIDGKVHERIFLTKNADKYVENINLQDKGLESIAKRCLKIGLDQYAYHIRYNDYIVQGSAESLLKENEIKDYADENSNSFNSDVYCRADIDNDGKEEIYNKGIFFSSTRGMVTHLEYALCNTKGQDMIRKCLNGITYPHMFWVEKSEQGNIVCILSLDNLLDYTIYGFNITKGKVKEVFRDTFTGDMKIKRTIYTTGINLEDEEW